MQVGIGQPKIYSLVCPRAHFTAASTGKAASLGGFHLRGPHATFITFIHSRGVPMRNIAPRSAGEALC